MESKANYTIVGLVVLILTAGLLATALWLSVGFGQKEYNTYVVCLNEAASGLSEDAVVKFNGVKVGYVKKIKLDRQNPQQVILFLAIESGTPITVSTYATLISQGITGVSYVGLSATNSDLTPLKKSPDYPYPIIPSKPSLFNQLDTALKEVSDNVNKVSLEIRRVFDRENAENLKKTMVHIEKFSDMLAENSGNMNIFMKNMADMSKDLPQVIKEIKTGVKEINIMAADMAAAGKSVSSTMKAGKVTIDQISQQTVPSAVSLIKRLDLIAANLVIVSSKMRQNPSVIIRGTTPPKPGPGE